VSQTRVIMILLLLAALLGCAVGPNYRRPDMAVPQQQGFFQGSLFLFFSLVIGAPSQSSRSKLDLQSN
jgi:uncharacterized protein YybS (DUF2232 family)